MRAFVFDIQDTESKDVKIDAVWKYLGNKVQEHQATFPITGAQLHDIFSGTSQERCDEVASIINKYSDKFEINTPLRMAHFLGQIGAETGGLVATKEIPCYKEKAIRANFGASKYCDLYVGFDCVDLSACATESETVKCSQGVPTTNEEIKKKYICSSELFDYCYSCSARKPGSSGDLGNGPPSSKDGSTFMGRGFIQLTGKANYEIVSNAWNNDIENANNKKYFHKQTSDGGHIDELVSNLDIGLKASLYFWKKKKLNRKADEGITDNDIDNLGYVINGTNPPNDYKTRRKYTNEAFEVLKK